jgi:hypothetical protein
MKATAAISSEAAARIGRAHAQVMMAFAFTTACHSSATQSKATGGATAPAPVQAISPAHDSLFKRLHVDASRVKVAYLRCDDPSSPYPLDGGAADGVVVLDTTRPEDKSTWKWYLVPADSTGAPTDSTAPKDYLIVTVDGPPKAMDGSRADRRVGLSPDIDPDNVTLRWTFVLTPYGSYQIRNSVSQAVIDGGATDKRVYLNKESNPVNGFQRWRIEFQ